MAYPNAVPAGSTSIGAYGTSDLYVGIPTLLGGGTGTFAATLSGLSVGDLLMLEPPLDYATGTSAVYTAHRVTAASVVTVTFWNPTGTGIAATQAKAWRYKWWDLTPVAEVGGQNPS